MKEKTLPEKGQTLLQWYLINKRDLPWRHTHDPYRIWISEIMLQQTRVDTVIDYYHLYLNRFPDIQTLANATEEEVLETWKGLGYYSRARNMHKAAKWIMENCEGLFPRKWEEVKGLPGIGEYTAGAICSIAYNEPWPAVDGNVLRVISRLEGLEDDIGTEKTRKKVAAIAQQMIPQGQARDFTQALMELGALVCTPTSPHCQSCSANTACEAFVSGRQEELPLKKKKNKPAEVISYWAVLLLKAEKLLMEYRNTETLLGQMWGVPLVEKTGLERSFLDKYNLSIKSPVTLGWVNHIFSHRVWKMEVVSCEMEEETSLLQDLRWVELSALKQMAIPKAFQKVLALLPENKEEKLTLVAEIAGEYNKRSE